MEVNYYLQAFLYFNFFMFLVQFWFISNRISKLFGEKKYRNKKLSK